MRKPSHAVVATAIADHFHATVTVGKIFGRLGDQVSVDRRQEAESAAKDWDRTQSELQSIGREVPEVQGDVLVALEASSEIVKYPWMSTMSTAMIDQY